MAKLFIKGTFYLILIVIVLEILVRTFHLYTQTPIRYIDEFNVEKSLANQSGYAVTGNRRQNFSEYRINNFGFNSYREFKPTEDKIEIALIGDSFIEGFHQNYNNSIGKKIENRLNDIEVYEYGYGGYDLANQFYLVDAYDEHFDKIDYIIFYLKYENDLKNDTYVPNHQRIELLKSPLFKFRDNFKLLSYISSIGIIDPIKHAIIDLLNNKNAPKSKSDFEQTNAYLENFKTLINTFGFDKNRMAFLLNSSTTSDVFIKYCIENEYQIIDFNQIFENSKVPPTLIYDMHWNNHGRTLIASKIANYLDEKFNL